jgi:hypothetical protein
LQEVGRFYYILLCCMLLDMCPHISTAYYSAACYSICVLKSPLHTTLLHATRYVSSYLHCILLCCMLLDMCPQISTAYYAACYSICVLKSLLHTTLLHATLCVLRCLLYCILL